MDFSRYLLWICIVGLVYWHMNAEPDGDKNALLDFVNNLHHSRPLNWNWSSDMCNVWTGVTCNEDGSRVVAVRLPGVGFQGPIPPNTLGRLSALQALSLRSNDITGDFPDDLFNLKNLSLLYLQFNNFSGPLPSDFTVWKNLTVVNLSYNRFSGSIPQSLSHLTELAALNLANNLFSGEIPDLEFPRLQHLNLSNNNLSGTVPQSLHKFPQSAFAGNNVTSDIAPQLFPAVAPASSSVPPSKSKHTRRMGLVALLVIIGGVVLLGTAAIAFWMYVCCSKNKSKDGFSGTLQKGQMSPEKVVSRSQDANNRLVFFGGCSYAFDLEDLLRASAEVLGKGTFGMAYKAILEDATTVVVKRLKELAVGKKEFEQHMEIIGNIKHENVVELKAYYYSKDEKLMVYDYHVQGSVSSILHGTFIPTGYAILNNFPKFDAIRCFKNCSLLET